jgi:peptidoglycan hydrolase CwlO-like protein
VSALDLQYEIKSLKQEIRELQKQIKELTDNVRYIKMQSTDWENVTSWLSVSKGEITL